MQVLGIESSCDETAVAIYSRDHGLVAHHVHSQIELHREWGGVVPELASRDHIRRVLPLIEKSLKVSGVSREAISGIAYTKGPGLVGALMVGASIGRALSYAWQIPAIGVHHMEAHLMAVMLEREKPCYPFVALLVSGGHTLLVLVQAFGQYQILGESLDDAVGEAFDKTAKLLGLPYPGGPALAKLAETGRPNRYNFPRPMIHRKELNFSFSGLKTHVVNVFRKEKMTEQARADIAFAFEEAVVDTLKKKCQDALVQTNLDQLVMVGGVSANKKLRSRLEAELEAKVFYPRPEFCTDNGAMVAYTGYIRLSLGQREPLAIDVKPRWAMSELSSP